MESQDLQAMVVLRGELVGLAPPISPQDQFSNSSKFDDKMLGLGWGLLARFWNGCGNQIAS